MTPTQNAALTYIRGYIDENGYSPSYVEISHALGLKGQGRIAIMLTALRDYGYLTFVPGRSRSITMVEPVLSDIRRVLNRYEGGEIDARSLAEHVRTITIAAEAFR